MKPTPYERAENLSEVFEEEMDKLQTTLQKTEYIESFVTFVNKKILKKMQDWSVVPFKFKLVNVREDDKPDFTVNQWKRILTGMLGLQLSQRFKDCTKAGCKNCIQYLDYNDEIMNQIERILKEMGSE